MAKFSDYSQISPLPIVDLREISLPEDGFLVALPEACKLNFNKGDSCRDHYATLGLRGATNPGQPVQCPYGFASTPFLDKTEPFALTGYIPYPRLLGAAEKQNAKRFPKNKLDSTSVAKVGKGLIESLSSIVDVENDTLLRHSAALHEIRKLNAKVKQNAERLYRDVGTLSEEELTRKTLNIFRASEMMSQQFEVMELLANHNLAELPLNARSEIVRLFHKCIKVYENPDEKSRVELNISHNYSPKILACDKTIPIIPTVLLQNAEKYATAKSVIRVSIEPRDRFCVITVVNLSEGQQELDDSIFKRGVRASADTDGSGNGLFVAQLVAKQHGTRINVKTEVLNSLMVRHTFEVVFETIE